MKNNAEYNTKIGCSNTLVRGAGALLNQKICYFKKVSVETSKTLELP